MVKTTKSERVPRVKVVTGTKPVVSVVGWQTHY
jgi:hypothetical protein